MDDQQPTVRIGRVIKPHGVSGELVVEPLGDSLADLVPGALLGAGKAGQRELIGIRPHAGRWLVTLDGVGDRDAAEALRGAWLRLPESMLAAAGSDEAYVDDLVGCELRDEHGETLGRVVGVVSGAAHDMLEVESAAGPRLVPMVADWLLELDTEAGFVSMKLPEGLA